MNDYLTPDRVTVGVVIEVAEPYADEILQWRMGFGDPYADRMPTHITLLPPCTMSEQQMTRLFADLCSLAEQTEPFEVTLGPVGTFRPTSPVVFLHARDAGDRMLRLEEQVRTVAGSPERRHPFAPHVTVAMAVGDGLLDAAAAALADYRCAWVADAVSLFTRDDRGRWLLEARVPFAQGM